MDRKSLCHVLKSIAFILRECERYLEIMLQKISELREVAKVHRSDWSNESFSFFSNFLYYCLSS